MDITLIYDRLYKMIYDSKVIHVDESPVNIMQIDHVKIKKGKNTYICVYQNSLCAAHILSFPLTDSHPIIRNIPENS